MGRALLYLLSMAAALPLAGCHEGELDGAVVRRTWAFLSNGFPDPEIDGDDCEVVRRGHSSGSERHVEHSFYAFRTISDQGSVRTQVYVIPAGAPPDFVLTVDNGELARELKLNRASFEDQEILRDTVITYNDEVVELYHFFTEDCEAIEYPSGDLGPP